MKSSTILVFLAAALPQALCAQPAQAAWQQYKWDLDECQQKYTNLALNNCPWGGNDCLCPEYSLQCPDGTVQIHMGKKKRRYLEKRKGGEWGPVCKGLGDTDNNRNTCGFVNTGKPKIPVKGPGVLPPLRNGFVDGWGGIHIDQYKQKDGKANLTIIIFDAASPAANVVGCTLDPVVVSVNQDFDLDSRLPAVLLVRVLPNDDLHFAYNGLEFLSNGTYNTQDAKNLPYCQHNGWSKQGLRQWNCGFTIASGRGAWQQGGTLVG